jgi:hypothetical protein
MTDLRKTAINVGLVMKTILEMSDDVNRGQSPLDTQGKLLRLQSSIQKNRARIQKLCDELVDHLSNPDEAA